MSGIENCCKLSLALDRIYQHGHVYLDAEIDTEEMRKAIKALQTVIANIPDWDEFIEDQMVWWSDLTEEKA